jgi:xanthine dehydrogenase YagS FAD-binding subunit
VPGSGCPAVSGEHHNMAILGASDRCIATHPSDLAVALVAFDAMVQVHEPTGAREVPITELYRPVGDTPHLELTTAPGALITGVRLPGLAMAAGSRYRKVRERASYAFAIGSIAAALDVADGRVAGVRIALGAVASMPWRARRAEEILIGRPVDAASFALAADAELAAARPLPGNAYKVALVRNLIVRMLSDLAGDRP